MSATTGSAFDPHRSPTTCKSSRRQATRATDAPLWASCTASASPVALLAPVIITTRFFMPSPFDPNPIVTNTRVAPPAPASSTQPFAESVRRCEARCWPRNMEERPQGRGRHRDPGADAHASRREVKTSSGDATVRQSPRAPVQHSGVSVYVACARERSARPTSACSVRFTGVGTPSAVPRRTTNPLRSLISVGRPSCRS